MVNILYCVNYCNLNGIFGIIIELGEYLVFISVKIESYGLNKRSHCVMNLRREKHWVMNLGGINIFLILILL